MYLRRSKRHGDLNGHVYFMNVLVLFILGFGVGRGLAVGSGEIFCRLGGSGLNFGFATFWSGHACNVGLKCNAVLVHGLTQSGVYYEGFWVFGNHFPRAKRNLGLDTIRITLENQKCSGIFCIHIHRTNQHVIQCDSPVWTNIP